MSGISQQLQEKICSTIRRLAPMEKAQRLQRWATTQAN
jgi:hypothetical protein